MFSVVWQMFSNGNYNQFNKCDLSGDLYNGAKPRYYWTKFSQIDEFAVK